MNILVTGGTGFIGSSIVTEAVARGHNVAVLSRVPKSSLSGTWRVIEGSIGKAPWREINEFKPDTCVHSAWIATPGVYLNSPKNDIWYEESLEFLARLPEMGARHIYALGTCLEYGESSHPISEHTPAEPNTPYARSKYQLMISLQEILPSDVSLGWIRLFYPFGDGEPNEKLVTTASRRLKAEEKIVLKSPYDLVDYVHVSDVGSAILSACEGHLAGPINVGSGKSVTVAQLVSLIAEIMGKFGLISWEAEKPPVLTGRVALLDKLASIGWQPHLSLEAGLRRFLTHNS